MTAYGCKEQFVNSIRQRIKRQTMRNFRAEPSRHARPGELIQLYARMRRPDCYKIIPDPVCMSVEPVRLNLAARSVIIGPRKGARRLHRLGDVNDFAQADGFDDWRSLCAWFQKTHGITDSWSGVLICWRDAPPA